MIILFDVYSLYVGHIEIKYHTKLSAPTLLYNNKSAINHQSHQSLQIIHTGKDKRSLSCISKAIDRSGKYELALMSDDHLDQDRLSEKSHNNKRVNFESSTARISNSSYVFGGWYPYVGCPTLHNIHIPKSLKDRKFIIFRY